MPKIIIVGGGVQGLSTAHWLWKLGERDFLVLEAGVAGQSGNTPRSAAMLVHQTNVRETTELARRSIKQYREIHDLPGVDLGFAQTGGLLFSSTADGRDALRAQALMQRELGLETETLEPTVLEERYGHLLNVEGLTLGIFCAAEGYLDPRKLLAYYLSDIGSYVRNNAKVSSIETNNAAVCGVRLADGSYLECEVVVNAAGSFAKRLAATIDISLPIRNSERGLVIIARGDIVPSTHPLIEHFEDEWYFRPHSRGVLFGLGPKEWVSDEDSLDDPQFTDEHLHELQRYLDERMPAFVPYEIVDKWSGYRPLLAADEGATDEFPILGPSELVSGYVNCCGAGAYGVTLGSASGELVATSITSPSAEISRLMRPFLSDRFESPIDGA